MVIPREGDPILIVFTNEREEVERTSWIPNIRTYHALHEMMVQIIEMVNAVDKEKPRIGIEVGFHIPAFLVERFKMANPTAEVVQERTMIEAVRKRKDPVEKEAIQKACELASWGMEVVQSLLKPGVREKDVAIELEYQLKKRGADGLGFPPFVNSGYRSLWLHGLATSKVIEKGELVLVDFAPIYEGYHANISRTFVVGRASKEQRKAMETYRRLQEKALEAIGPERPLFQVEQEIEDLAKTLPYGEHYIRGFIHGIGVAFEEFPFPTIFPEDIMAPLENDMALAVGHPVLSVPGLGGFKIEDTVMLSEGKVIKWTTFPNDLIEV